MKVVHIITGLGRGGAEGVLARLVQHQNRGTVDSVVVSLTDEGFQGPKLRAAGVKVLTLGMSRSALSLRPFMTLVRTLRIERPDVVQTWMYHADLLGGIAARIARVPRIVWGLRNSSLDSKRTSWKTHLVVRICGLLSRWIPDAIVCCAMRVGEENARFGYDKEKFVLIENGFDIDQMQHSVTARELVRQRYGIGSMDIVIGCVARWHPQKDHATLFRAFDSLPVDQTTKWLLLVGPDMTDTNPELSMLRERSLHGNHFILSGPCDEVAQMMSAIDLHVLPSAYGEGFPNVVAEAMACGVPCVVTDVGDSSSIVEGIGLVAERGDWKDLAAAIARLLERLKGPSSDALKAACRQRIVDRYSIDEMSNKFLKVWGQSRS